MEDMRNLRAALKALKAQVRTRVRAWGPRAASGVALAAAALGVGAKASAQQPGDDPSPLGQACVSKPAASAASAQEGKLAMYMQAAPPATLTAGGAPWIGLVVLYGAAGPWHDLRMELEAIESATDPAARAAQRAILAEIFTRGWRRQRLPSTPDAAADAAKLDAVFVAVEALLDAPAVETDRAIHALLDRAEAAALYDPWIVGWAFRRLQPVAQDPAMTSAQGQALAHTLGRLERFARDADAAFRTRITDMVEGDGRPWMSKAAPPPGWNMPKLPPDFGDVIQRVYPDATASTWQAESVRAVEVTHAPAGATLWRRGGAIPLTVGDRFWMTRLDVLITPPDASDPLTLKTLVGDLTVTPDRALNAWNANALLDAKGKMSLTLKLEGAAERCDPIDQMALQAALILSHPLLRARVQSTTPGPGAPALRLLLALFDM
jgi:hypothetical protein